MIAIVDYGAGNLRSVEFALDRIGVAHRRATRPDELEDAAGIVLPGVGHAASAMTTLERTGLADAVRAARPPVLGICLGLQLLTARSDEADPPVPCLGVVPGRARRLRRAGLRVPQIGWNFARFTEPADPLFDGLGDGAWFYFLHSLRVRCPPEVVTAEAEYGGAFPAAVRHGPFRGVQFHPEKSGPAGLRVLENFCRACGTTGPPLRRADPAESDGGS